MLHLDSAAVGRSSTATLEAVAAHARLESELGGYIAQERARDRLDGLRRDTAVLLGSEPDGVAFVESATAAFEALVGAWPLPRRRAGGCRGVRVGPEPRAAPLAGPRGPAAARGRSGRLDLAALETLLAGDPPDVVLVDQLAAHRGLVQPAAEVIELGREHGVPVWLDAAQAVGHLPVPPGADAVFATSRKWLAGPRGVGMLAVAERHRPLLRVRRPAKQPGPPAAAPARVGGGPRGRAGGPRRRRRASTWRSAPVRLPAACRRWGRSCARWRATSMAGRSCSRRHRLRRPPLCGRRQGTT